MEIFSLALLYKWCKCCAYAETVLSLILVSVMLRHQLAPPGAKRRAASGRWKSLPAGIASGHGSPTCYLLEVTLVTTTRVLPGCRQKQVGRTVM